MSQFGTLSQILILHAPHWRTQDFILGGDNRKKLFYIHGATAPKSQDRLKWLLSDGRTGGLVISKVLIPQP